MALILRTRAVIAGESGLPGLTTFYWRGTDGDDAEATAALAGVRSYFEAAKAYLSGGQTVTYDTAVAVLVDTSGALSGMATADAQAITTSSGAGDLPGLCMLGLQLNTGTVVNGRILRGRSFFGPLNPEAVNAGGTPATAARTALQTAGEALLAVSAVSLVVWHRPRPGSGGLAVDCTGVGTSPKVWALRSRRD